MAINAEQVDEKIEVQRYPLQYPLSDYTFPRETPRIHEIHFDDDYLHVDLIDGRKIAIPLAWIPTLHHADHAQRKQYEINRSRTGILWDPDKSGINDEIFIRDYLGPTRSDTE